MKSEDLNRIRELLSPLFGRSGVIKAVLFGSFSRETGTKKSDLDLMIVKDTARRFFDRYEEFDAIHGLISDRAVDLLIYTPEELQNISHRPFVRKILEEGITIYEH
jgi:predicted nucleotidyltransferase